MATTPITHEALCQAIAKLGGAARANDLTSALCPGPGAIAGKRVRVNAALRKARDERYIAESVGNAQWVLTDKGRLAAEGQA